jgi:hypothetical protein
VIKLKIIKRTIFTIIAILIVGGGVYIYNQEKMVPIGLFTCSLSEIPDNLIKVIGKNVKYTFRENEDGSFIVYVKNKEYIRYLDLKFR